MSDPRDMRERLREVLRQPPKPSNTKAGKAWRRKGVRESVEFLRIAGLPRRVKDEAEAEALAAEIGPLLAREGGTMRPRPIQAQALDELAQVGGLVGAIRVGGGKTLITRLAPRAVDAERPVLVLPAKLIPKTITDFDALEEHFDCGPRPVLISYTALGLEQNAEALRELRPDLLILDEAHKAKNPKAAVTRRIRRYLEETPSCKVVILSGTLISRKLSEAAHLFEWALAERSPLPREWAQVTEWGLCVDTDIPTGTMRAEPGALVQLMSEDEAKLAAEDETEAVRRAVCRRMTETHGVVATSGTFLGASLVVNLIPFNGHGPEVCAAVERLREKWETPDGWPVADAAAKWRHVNELSHGFYYVWDPRPPKPWANARRVWGATCRHVLEHNRQEIDSEKQLKGAIDRGLFDGKKAISNGLQIGDGTIPENLAAWRAIEPSFTANQVPVWLDDAIAVFVDEWARAGAGIVWVQSIALGERLADVLGLPYYGAEARDAKRRHVRDADPAEGSIVCSIASCGEGENLQRFARNLVIAPTLGGGQWEQLLGRTHRDGQKADEVVCDVLVACTEQYRGFRTAIEQARNAQATQGQDQKLLYADIVDTLKDGFPFGPFWPEMAD